MLIVSRPRCSVDVPAMINAVRGRTRVVMVVCKSAFRGRLCALFGGDHNKTGIGVLVLMEELWGLPCKRSTNCKRRRRSRLWMYEFIASALVVPQDKGIIFKSPSTASPRVDGSHIECHVWAHPNLSSNHTIRRPQLPPFFSHSLPSVIVSTDQDIHHHQLASSNNLHRSLQPRPAVLCPSRVGRVGRLC